VVHGDTSYYVLMDRATRVLVLPKMVRQLRVSSRQLITAKRATFQSLDRTPYLLDHRNRGNLCTALSQYIISIPNFSVSSKNDGLHLPPCVSTRRASVRKTGKKRKLVGLSGSGAGSDCPCSRQLQCETYQLFETICCLR
jgi:hypothetical protein